MSIGGDTSSVSVSTFSSQRDLITTCSTPSVDPSLTITMNFMAASASANKRVQNGITEIADAFKKNQEENQKIIQALSEEKFQLSSKVVQLETQLKEFEKVREAEQKATKELFIEMQKQIEELGKKVTNNEAAFNSFVSGHKTHVHDYSNMGRGYQTSHPK